VAKPYDTLSSHDKKTLTREEIVFAVCTKKIPETGKRKSQETLCFLALRSNCTYDVTHTDNKSYLSTTQVKEEMAHALAKPTPLR
jgi:hypothetical protein